jgi:hypothetical protein
MLVELGHPADASASVNFVPGLIRLDATDGGATLS